MTEILTDEQTETQPTTDDAEYPDAPEDTDAALRQALETTEVGQEILNIAEDIEKEVDLLMVFIEEALKDVGNAELIPHVLKKNALKYVRDLTVAASEVATKKRAVYSCFGQYVSVTNLPAIRLELLHVWAELRTYRMVEPDFETFKTEVLPHVDKYLFDGRNIEAARNIPHSLCILQSRPRLYKDPDFVSRLKKAGFFDEDPHNVLHFDDDVDVFAQSGVTYETVDSFVNLFDVQKTLPDIVILEIPQEDEDRFTHFQEYYLFNLPEGKQPPQVIVYFRGGKIPLYRRQQCAEMGWIMTSNAIELRHAIAMSKDLLASMRMKPEFFDPAVLSRAQEILYNNSDLREWEKHTADTYQSMQHLLRLMRRWRTEEVPGYRKPAEPTVLDCGTGEGRISILLDMLGCHITGIDMAEIQLGKVPVRMDEELEGYTAALAGKPVEDTKPLSYPALLQLVEDDARAPQDEKLIPRDVITNKETLLQNYVRAKGDFAHLRRDVEEAMMNMPYDERMRFYNIDEGGDTNPFPEDNRFSEAGYDFVLFNWHTLCEGGSIDGIKAILQQAFEVMKRGAYIVIEIPDRQVGPYALSLQEYSRNHLGEPFGTIRDSTSTDPGVSTTVNEDSAVDTPRYFPDRNELVLLLQAMGFEINPVQDVMTYLITNEDPTTQNPMLQAKELFICARKPAD